VVDFTDLDNIREVAYADLEETTGQADRVVVLLVQRPHLLEQRSQPQVVQPRRRRLPAHRLARRGDEPGAALVALEPADAGGMAGAVT
jgi:hypothetical protein